MPWLLQLGLGLSLVGGFAFFASLIAGEIPRKWPFKPINRHDEPERFEFWQDVSGGALALGVIILLALSVSGRLT
jgi:hypothetical protein